MKAEISLLGLLAFLLAVPAQTQGIYKWEDENGQMHFSDMPRAGAVEVEVAPVQTFDSSVADGNASDEEDGGKDNTQFGYNAIKIVSPSDEETIWNTGGTVMVKFNVSPGLKPGHLIRLFFNGQSLENLVAGTNTQIPGVDRGTHSLQAEILNRNGDVLMQSDPVTFYYKQSTSDSRLIPVQPPQAENPIARPFRQAPNRIRPRAN